MTNPPMRLQELSEKNIVYRDPRREDPKRFFWLFFPISKGKKGSYWVCYVFVLNQSTRGCESLRLSSAFFYGWNTELLGGFNSNVSVSVIARWEKCGHDIPMTDPNGAAMVTWIPSTKNPVMLAYMPVPWIRHGVYLHFLARTVESYVFMMIRCSLWETISFGKSLCIGFRSLMMIVLSSGINWYRGHFSACLEDSCPY